MRQVDSRHVLTTMMSLIVTNETSAHENIFVQQNSLSQCHTIIKCCFSSQLVVLVVLAGAAQATPGGGYGKPKCRTVYETSYTTSYEEKCSTSYEQQCSTSYEEQCSTSYEQECSTSYETSYEKSCSTTYEKVKKMVLLIFARFPLIPIVRFVHREVMAATTSGTRSLDTGSGKRGGTTVTLLPESLLASGCPSNLARTNLCRSR